MTTKRCSACKETKPVSEFYKVRTQKDGLHNQCKSCHRKTTRKWREANKEKKAETNRRWYEANKEHVKERQRKWREANKEKVAEHGRRYREANKEKIYEKDRRWREANREQENRRATKQQREINKLSLELAHRQRLPWEDWEDEFVMADNGLTNYQKAVKLGRSYASVRGRCVKLRKSARAELTTDTVRV